MKDGFYSKFTGDDLILRDQLAVERTVLANERTLLAYLRSAVALLIAGVSIIHVSEQEWFWMVGIACIPAGIIAGVIGMVRYRKMRDAIALINGKENTPPKEVLREKKN